MVPDEFDRCFGRSWRSAVCLFDNFLHDVLHISFTPVCRWHDWLLSRQFDREEEEGEPVELSTPPGGIRFTRVQGHPLLVESLQRPTTTSTATRY